VFRCQVESGELAFFSAKKNAVHTVRNAHENNLGAHEMVHMRTNHGPWPMAHGPWGYILYLLHHSLSNSILLHRQGVALN